MTSYYVTDTRDDENFETFTARIRDNYGLAVRYLEMLSADLAADGYHLEPVASQDNLAAYRCTRDGSPDRYLSIEIDQEAEEN